jgi:transglutaminase-like putative cysteine protease
MRFASAHKMVTYLLVLASLAAVASTGALAATSALAFAIAAALSFPVEAGGRIALALDRASAVLRVAALALFAAIAWRLWRHLPDPDVGPAFDLLFALLGYKLFLRRAHRDYVQIAALTFLLVVVASTIAHSFIFIATFAAYVVVAVWALILFHLRREMEENYLIKHSAQAPSQKVGVGRILGSRRVVGGTFFVATAGMAAIVFVGAVAIFMLVPRVGAGFAVGVARMSGSAAGFADEITIGRYGTRPAHRRDVVLRATLPDLLGPDDDDARNEVAEELYFRGAAYDGYEGGRWIHSHKPDLRTIVVQDGGRYQIGEDRDAMKDDAAAGSIRQEIEAIGIPASVLIAIDRPRAFELPATKLGAAGALRVFPRWSGEAALRVGGGDGDTFITLSHAHYVAFSHPPSGAAAEVAPLTPTARAAYLAVPEDLSRRLANLAATLGDRPAIGSLGQGPSSPDALIAAVTHALRATHGYTLEPRPAPTGVDPVESFLLGEHAGHCELFASAAVLLLRLRGVPARYVTGFRGGEWNAVGNYVAVRDDRAHAWAEAFLPDRGWVRVDATPPGAPLPRAGRVSEMMDALDYFWNRWVVGYDLGRQLELARRAGRHLAPRAAHDPARIATIVAGACVLAAFLFAARRWRRRRARSVRDAHEITRGPIWTASRLGPVERLYRRTLGRLARAGCPRRPNETPHEYAERVGTSGLISDDDFRQLTERYAAARFGGHDADDNVIADLAAKLAIRTASRSHTGSAPSEPRG